MESEKKLTLSLPRSLPGVDRRATGKNTKILFLAGWQACKKKGLQQDGGPQPGMLGGFGFKVIDQCAKMLGFSWMW